MAEIGTIVEPGQEYLGVTCHNCQSFVAMVGPLDLAKMPPDQPMRIGAREPLHVECPHCKQGDDYRISELRRERKD